MRLIDADAIYNKAVGNRQNGEIEDWEADSIIDYLDGAPTINDAEIVVRCKYCAHLGHPLSNGYYDCKKYMLPCCRPNDFCSHGKRKEDLPCES